MQTFLPYEDFYKSLKCLDNKRLGKQRLEARQIITVLERSQANENNNIAWRHHPAVKMWENSIPALCLYYNISLQLWAERGFQNIKLTPIPISPIGICSPHWLGYDKFHSSHRAALLHKYYNWYSRFNWEEQPKLDYFWPTEHHKEIIQYHYQKRVEKKKK